MAELRDKHMFRFAAAYGVAAWLIVQVTATVAPAFNLPPWFLRAVIVAAVIGFFATITVIFLRERLHRSGAARTRRGSLTLGLGVASLIAVVVGLGFASKNAVLAAEPVTLAVLPFADMSPAHDKGYLADGVAEEILSALGKNGGLKIIGRTTAFSLRERASDPQALRASLGITHLLEGSIRSAGQDLRLNIRLVRTKDATEEWAEEYNGKNGEIFALQDKIARSVAGRLNAATRPQLAPKNELTTADAYSLYLAARQIARTRDEPHLKRAFSMASKVVATEPSYAPGHALLGEVAFLLSDAGDAYGHIPFEKARSFGIGQARMAISLAPNLADGYAALGVALHDHRAIEPLRRAIKLDATRSDVRLWLANTLDGEARYKDSLAVLREAAEIDPLFPAVISRLVIDLSAVGRQEEAEQVIRRFELRGGDPAQVARLHVNKALFSDDLSEVVRWGEEARRLDANIPYVPRSLLQAYRLLGLPARQAAIRPDTAMPVRYAFSTRGYVAAVSAAGPIAPASWNRPDFEWYVFALAALRDYGGLTALFDEHAGPPIAICDDHLDAVPSFIVALQRTGRARDAIPLTACFRQRIQKVQVAGPRNPAGVLAAQLLAIDGKETEALTAIKAQIKAGWNQSSYRLDEFPAFDGLRGHPDFAAAQSSLDAVLIREGGQARQPR